MQGKLILIVLATYDISAHFLVSIDAQASFTLPRSGLHCAATGHPHKRKRSFFIVDCYVSDTDLILIS